ncbi:MAG: hypothetical protein JWM11_6828, partial [Planctomycetaceae bacterium]|nr:hypothetical protein [Planctomycetaceae bacterium]
LIDGICQELKITVAFLSADGGIAVFFPTKVGPIFPTEADARSFDDARRKWVREWKPDAILVIEKWDRYQPDDFDRRLPELIQEFEPYTQRLIFFSQVPVLPVGESVNLREFVTSRLMRSGSLPRMLPDKKEPIRFSVIKKIEALAKINPKLQLVRVDSPFYLQDGSIKYSSGRTFFYLDDDHLCQAGVELLRETCFQAIAAACAL